MNTLKNALVDRLIDLALEEDMGRGDISGSPLASQMPPSEFRYLAKQDMVLCGLDFVRRVFALLDPSLIVTFHKKDGDKLQKGDIIGTVQGATASILAGERTTLNFLQRLSGIATITARYADILKGSSVRLLDTRKTTPGWRVLEKYAVRTGGGYNHRFGLFDGVMLKDNHIDAAGGITNAVRIVRDETPTTIRIEVETRNLAEVEEAVLAGADIIMLDNFDDDKVREACALVAGRAKVEISGGVTPERLEVIRNLPVDYVSVGALTHQATSVDISLKYARRL